jgi:hypothetical protein
MSPVRAGRARGRVLFIHGGGAGADEAAARTKRLRAAGYEVIGGRPEPSFLRGIDEAPPAAALIDLSRAHVMGRDVALWIRQRKALRATPIIFVDVDPARAAAVEKLVPCSTFTTWSRVLGALRVAMARPVPRTARPVPSLLAGYSGTPLPKKLGIKEGSTVALIGAPAGFEKVLGDLPAGARVVRRAPARADLTLWFPATRRELTRDVRRRGLAATERGGLWIAWPKKASGVATDLTEAVVRAAGLGNGLVDFKICAIDATWSGLRFARRRSSGGT